MHEMSSSPSQPPVPSSAPKKRKVTHIPPPPIPQWALASRPAVAAAPQATKQAPLRAPSALEHPTRPTDLSTIAAPEIQSAATTAKKSDPDKRGRQRGRPKGSKNWADASAALDLSNRPRPKRVEERPNYRVRKTREPNPQKPARPPSPSPRDIYDKLDPLFVHFFCEWEGCNAQMDNFAKLKKHIVVAHGEEVRGNKRCRWGKCSHLSNPVGVNAAPRIFASVEDLLCHTDACHLIPILWHMGDGRHGQGIVTNDQSVEYAAYLFWNGHQATPSVRHQKLETVAEMRERQRKLKDILDQAYANAPVVEESDLEDSADEESHLINPS